MLGIVLLVICSVLFVSVSYQAHGKWTTEEKKIKGSVSWLFSLLHYSFYYDEKGLVTAFRIFGIKKREKASQKEFDSKKQSGTQKKSDRKIFKRKKQEQPIRSKKDFSQETEENAVHLEKKTDSDFPKSKTKEEIEKKDFVKEKEEKTWLEKIQEKISAFFHHIKCKIKRIYDIIKNGKEKWEWYRDFWQEETTRNAVAFVKKEIFSLLKKIKPKKIKGYLRFGMDDPAATGMIYGVGCMLQSATMWKVKVLPEFEQKILEGDIYLKGKIRIFTLIKSAMKLYFHKDVKLMKTQWDNKSNH